MGTEMTETEAREMIEKICMWLKEGAPGAVVDNLYESVAVDLARGFCREMLDVAGANSMGGCPLCQW
jgi:hypothetical protein